MPKCDFNDYKNMIKKISKFIFIKEFFSRKMKKCKFFWKYFIFELEYSKISNYLTYIC